MPLRLGNDMPAFEGASEWLNGSGEGITPTDLKGKITLVHFWAVSCYICKKNLPLIQAMKAQYPDESDFAVVAIHMPRQETDTNVDAVKEAIAEFQITEQCAVDNQHKLKDAFQNDQAFVPAYYLFDAEGKLKSRTAGDAGLGMVKATLDKLMNERKNAASDNFEIAAN